MTIDLDALESLQNEPDDLMYRASMQAIVPALAAEVRELRLHRESANAQCRHYAEENEALRARVAVLEKALNIGAGLQHELYCVTRKRGTVPCNCAIATIRAALTTEDKTP